MAVTPGKDLTPRKEAPPKTRMKTDVKETHGARRIMIEGHKGCQGSGGAACGG